MTLPGEVFESRGLYLRMSEKLRHHEHLDGTTRLYPATVGSGVATQDIVGPGEFRTNRPCACIDSTASLCLHANLDCNSPQRFLQFKRFICNAQ